MPSDQPASESVDFDDLERLYNAWEPYLPTSHRNFDVVVHEAIPELIRRARERDELILERDGLNNKIEDFPCCGKCDSARLRAELKRAGIDRDEHVTLAAQYLDEAARLREALDEIERKGFNMNGGACARIARAALVKP